MSNSTLSITVWSGPHQNNPRTFEVPCRLPEAFNFQSGGWLFTALVSGVGVSGVGVYDVESEASDFSAHDYAMAKQRAESILATIKATLGITGPVPPGSPLPAIALAYEAEVAAYEALVKAHAHLPRETVGVIMYFADPRTDKSRAAFMLAKYVEHVVEQAAKVTP